MSISIPLNTTVQYSFSSSSLVPSFSIFSPITSSAVSITGIRQRCLRMVTSCVSNAHQSVQTGATDAVSVVGRDQIRLGLPSKGRMAADSLDLLKVSVLGVVCVSPSKIEDCARGKQDMRIYRIEQLAIFTGSRSSLSYI